jgi:hypothetical protein
MVGQRVEEDLERTIPARIKHEMNCQKGVVSLHLGSARRFSRLHADSKLT